MARGGAGLRSSPRGAHPSGTEGAPRGPRRFAETARDGGIETLGKAPGIILAGRNNAADAAPAFIDAIAAHRHPSRDSDPPKV